MSFLVVAATAAGCAGPSEELRAESPGTPAVIRAESPGVVEEGKATYYSRRLIGRRTASGERYDPALMTAAHHALPLGTRVRVTRLDVALPPVSVRINDRCAGVHKIIDLSEAAARRLQMMRAGIVPVRLEVLSGPRRP